MSNIIKVKKAEVKPIIEVSFPEYKGRTFKVKLSEFVTFYNTNWDGGSRNQYVAVSMAKGKGQPMPVSAPWANLVEGKRMEIPFGVVVVEHSHYCGKDVGITIHAHPSMASSMIASGK